MATAPKKPAPQEDESFEAGSLRYAAPRHCPELEENVLGLPVVPDSQNAAKSLSFHAEESGAIAARIFERITELELELAARDFNIPSSGDDVTSHRSVAASSTSRSPRRAAWDYGSWRGSGSM
jgi:hypothetical protein